jgi:hypothetical protein
MLYKKIGVEVIVVADEAEAVVAELNAALDRLKEPHTLRWWNRGRRLRASGKTKQISPRAHDRRR